MSLEIKSRFMMIIKMVKHDQWNQDSLQNQSNLLGKKVIALYLVGFEKCIVLQIAETY